MRVILTLQWLACTEANARHVQGHPPDESVSHWTNTLGNASSAVPANHAAVQQLAAGDILSVQSVALGNMLSVTDPGALMAVSCASY